MRFVIDARYAARPSGIGTYVRALGSRLAALSDGSAELRFWIAPDSAPLSNAARVTHHRVRSPKASVATLLWPAQLDALRADDVFHAPANILGFNLPCPTILTLHDVLWLTHPDWCQPNVWARPFSRRYFGTGIRHGIQKATRIITVSHAAADGILQYAPETRARLVVIPNAADPEFVPPSSRADAAAEAARVLGFDAPYFLVVGHNQHSKGHSYALTGFAGLCGARAMQQRLVFIQRLHRGGQLERLARRLGVADRVHFVDSLPRAALLSLMQAASALVQPSLSEGFGIPVLEAMSVGTPVIASDIPALREVLGGAGLLAKPASGPELGRAMQRLIDAPNLADELRARGLARAPAYSWDKTAELTWQVYRDVAAGHVQS